MYVCLCKGVTCSQIRAAVSGAGVYRMRDLARELGVATQCGRCASCAKSLLDETLGRMGAVASGEAAGAAAVSA